MGRKPFNQWPPTSHLLLLLCCCCCCMLLLPIPLSLLTADIFCLSPPPCPFLIRHVLLVHVHSWLSLLTSWVIILLSWSVELLSFCIEAYYFANSFLNYDVSKCSSQSKNTNKKELLAQLLRRIDARSLVFLDLPGNVIKLWLLIWFLSLD